MTASSRTLPAALFGLTLTALGPLIYLWSMDHPGLRATGLAATIPMVLGAAIASVCGRVDRRWRVRWVAIVTVLLATCWVAGFLWLAELPAAGPRSRAARAAEFTLPDALGRPVSLRERSARGPVLLVFFRGHW